MSLINKMLQDLDARGGAQSGRDGIPQMRGAVAGERNPRVLLAAGGGVAVILLAAAGWLGWQYLRGAPAGAPPRPLGASAAAAPPVFVPPVAAARQMTVTSPASTAPASIVVAATPPAAVAQARPAAAAAQGAPAAVSPDAGDIAATFARRPPREQRGAPVAQDKAEARQKRLAEEKAEAELAAELKAARRKARLARAEAEALAVGGQAKPVDEAAGAARAERARLAAAGAAASRAAARGEGRPVREGDAGRLSSSGGVTVTSQQQGENAYRRGLLALQEGRVQEALANMEQAVFLYPRHDTARQTLVGLLIENKRHDEAVRHLQFGLGLDAKQPQMAMILARLQMEKGGPAIETLQRTLPYAGGNGDYIAFLAGALQRAQRPREAAEQYQAALRLQPQNGVWWMGLGISLQADKRNAEAQDAFTRAKNAGNLSQELQSFVERKLQQLGR